MSVEFYTGVTNEERQKMIRLPDKLRPPVRVKLCEWLIEAASAEKRKQTVKSHNVTFKDSWLIDCRVAQQFF